MSRLALILSIAAITTAAASCGSARPHCDDCGGPMTDPTWTREHERVATERKHICDRVRELGAAKCAFDGLDPSLLADCSVVDSIYIAGVQDCLDLPPCDGVTACIRKVRLQGAPYRGPTTACNLGEGQESTVPAGVSEAELTDSYGLHDNKFSDSPSTKDRPIEVCGMPAQLEYLTRVTCADGSNPFADRDAADASRTGNVGDGGRCNRTIDQYKVPCPEHTYDVFIDPYRCLDRG